MTKRKTPAELAAGRSAAATKAAATRAARTATAAARAEQAPEAGLIITDPSAVTIGNLGEHLDGPGAPGPKPATAVVGETLKCQSIDGEISLSLLVPYKKFKLVMNMPEDVEDAQMLDFLLDNVLSPEDKDTLENLRDGAETFHFTMAWMDALGERLGASLGKSGPSSS